MDDKKSTDNKDSCKTCFWYSKSGYCTEGTDPPRMTKGPCDKHKSLARTSRK